MKNNRVSSVDKYQCETHDGRADMTNFEMDLFDTRINEHVKLEKPSDEDQGRCCSVGSSRNSIIKPACVPISILSLLIIALVFLPLFNEEDLESPIKLTTDCGKSCSSYLVESIPTGIPFKDNIATTDAWIKIIDNTEKYLDISAMYWNLNSSDYKTAIHGKRVFEALIRAGKRGVKVRIAENGNTPDLSDNSESKYLQDEGLAEVRSINMTRLLGSGIIHTKFMISDIHTVYIGSANMDWKSLSEVKELGIVVECPCIASDLYKIFSVYWKLGENGSVIPPKWPLSFRTPYNFSNKGKLVLNGISAEYFISSSPEPFNPKRREHDLDAIKKIIKSANHSVCISVMDYIPTTLYMKKNIYWPEIDNAIRDAGYRGVSVRMLISKWKYSRKEILPYLKSLTTINDSLPKNGSISIKLFELPISDDQKKIDHIRVNHAKYLVTEDTTYIGTSNWSGDYFITTAGVGMVFKQNETTKNVQHIFDRDWNSKYAKEI